MSVTKPVVFTSIEDAEVAYGKPVSEEVIRKMIQNSNLIGALCPIGSFRHMQINQPGAFPPNVKLWQMSDGTEITDPDSPLKSVVPTSRFTNDMRNNYVRGAPDEATNGFTGSATTDLSHSHDTGTTCTAIDGEEGDERRGYATLCHNHDMARDLSTAEPLDVANQQLAIYVKIN